MNQQNTIALLASRKLHARYKFQGMDISIENRKGSTRSGVARDGTKWSQKMPFDYGYIRRSLGTDGDHVDCFIGPDEKAKKVYIVHINHPDTGKYDEDKCMIGFSSRKAAMQAFNAAYDRPEKFYRSMTVMSVLDFKTKVTDKQNHGQKVAAVGYYMDVLPGLYSPKTGKSRVPTDDPGETDDKYLDVTNRKRALQYRLKLLTRKGGPVHIFTTDTRTWTA